MADFVQGRISSTNRRLDYRARGEHMLKVHQRNAVYSRLLKGTIDKYEAEYQRNFNRVQQNILSTYFKDFLPLRVTKTVFPNISYLHRSKSSISLSSYHTKRSQGAPPRVSFIKFKRPVEKKKVQQDPVAYDTWIRSLHQNDRVMPITSGRVY